MKNLFKIVFFICTVFFITTFLGCTKKTNNTSSLENIKSKGYITMATNADFEPFEFRDGYEIVGIDVDISKKIAENLGVDLKINDISFDAITFELKKNKCDFAAAGISGNFSESRAKNVDFSIPYIDASQVAIVPINSQINSLNDLTDKKIGVQLGTSADSYCTENENMGQIIRFNKDVDAISDLISGKIDVVITDNFPANKFVSKNPDKIKKLDTPITNEKYMIAVAKGNNELLDFINYTIKNMQENDEINQIIEKYIS